MILMQHLTGGSRPQEGNEPSDWKLFQDSNGVSGHAFVGALPFMTAAKMSDEIGLKIAFYTCAAFAGLSRIDDDAHYPSQVLLGWWMAYAAVRSVDL
jgi:membrane-associated phospholipid phosphatase